MSPHTTVDHTKPGHRPRFDPLRATTKTIHRPICPVAYDCLKLIVVRDGSEILFSEFGERYPMGPIALKTVSSQVAERSV